MLNLVEKFTPEAVEATDEDGVVAIEYVIVAGALVIAARRACGPPSASSWPSMAEIIDNVGNGSTPDPKGGGQPPPFRVLLMTPLTPIPTATTEASSRSSSSSLSRSCSCSSSASSCWGTSSASRPRRPGSPVTARVRRRCGLTLPGRDVDRRGSALSRPD